MAKVFVFLITLGIVLCEDQKRLLLDGNGNVEMNFETEITILKQRMALQSAQLANQSATLNSQTSEINQLRQQVTDLEGTKGSTYVRWGRNTCSGNGTSTVYSGYMAGTQVELTHTGSGANYLCLSSQPVWGHYTDTLENDIIITGVEYSFNPHQNSDIAQFLGSNVLGNEAPCAMCYAERGASIMIPGRTQCYPGWTEEYDGYLVTGYPGYDDSTEFVCLDKRPESVVGSGTVHSKNNLYFVEAKCGYDLECPPYVNGREISCVVCSR